MVELMFINMRFEKSPFHLSWKFQTQLVYHPTNPISNEP